MTMSPIISPSLSSASLTSLETPAIIRRVSTSSIGSLATLAATSAGSIASLPPAGQEVEVVREEGLRHAAVKLEARHYKKASFLQSLIDCISTLKISSWAGKSILPQDVQVQKVSGCLTNAVFFVSCPGTKTLLLRIYGPSSGEMISRPRELHTLHILSSRYGLGPRVFGTFENGRIEEYFESKTLTAEEIRDPGVSGWIGARMAELHSVDIEVVEDTPVQNRGEGRSWELATKKNIKEWLPHAKKILLLPALARADREALDLDGFERDWHRYLKWVSTVDRSRRVFAHNDAQYGNLLRLVKAKEGQPDHRQIIVVDFEYAAPNTNAYDIANHFHEWTANYHCSTPHLLDPTKYPTLDERRNFYQAYLTHTAESPLSRKELEQQMADLEEQVRYWSPSSHAWWAVWGIIQAKDDLVNDNKEPEFDYIAYAKCRMGLFRNDLRALGL